MEKPPFESPEVPTAAGHDRAVNIDVQISPERTLVLMPRANHSPSVDYVRTSRTDQGYVSSGTD